MRTQQRLLALPVQRLIIAIIHILFQDSSVHNIDVIVILGLSGNEEVDVKNLLSVLKIRTGLGNGCLAFL